MIGKFNMTAPVKEVADLNSINQGPLRGGQRDIMRNLTLTDTNLGRGYYAYCDLKRYGKFSNAASLLRDKKTSGLHICGKYAESSVPI